MKLSLSGMVPFVIGELVNSLFPCVDRDVTSRWRAFVGSFVKAHAMAILSYTRFFRFSFGSLGLSCSFILQDIITVSIHLQSL